MPTTYEPIATTTLGSAASSITFSSIPGTYTDLRLTFVGQASGTDYLNLFCQFNSDTGSNYSLTRLSGDGSSAASAQQSNQTRTAIANQSALRLTIPKFYTMDLFSYAGSTFKTMLCTGSEDENGAGTVVRSVNLWRSTSAVTSIYLFPSSANFATGTTATLYGILKA